MIWLFIAVLVIGIVTDFTALTVIGAVGTVLGLITFGLLEYLAIVYSK